MKLLDATTLTDDALLGYDGMMATCLQAGDEFATLAMVIWSEVLKELNRRGKVKLISGSYDDLASAKIERL